MGSASSHDANASVPPSHPPSSPSSPPAPFPCLVEGPLSSNPECAFDSADIIAPIETSISSPTTPSTPSSVPPNICNMSSVQSHHGIHDDDSDRVPTLLVWNGGGNTVSVAGSWDNWQVHIQLEQGTDDEHCTLLSLRPGDFQLKFLIDGVWKCAPYLPTCTDSSGNVNNLLTVHPRRNEFDTLAPLHARPPSSPVSSYDRRCPRLTMSDAPLLPEHLEARALKPLPDDISPSVTATRCTFPDGACADENNTQLGPRPAPPDVDVFRRPHSSYRPYFSHVFIDHLYVTRSASADDETQSISQTSRVGRKIINTVFVFNNTPRS